MSLDGLMTLAMPAINEAFGAAVRHELDSRGLSLRQTRIRTGIDIDTVGRMRAGDVPRIDKVIAFARGLKLDVNEWLVLAGYDPVEPSPDDAVRKLISAEESQVRSATGRVSASDRRRLMELFGGTEDD
jgi:hypothetical protein